MKAKVRFYEAGFRTNGGKERKCVVCHCLTNTTAVIRGSKERFNACDEHTAGQIKKALRSQG